MNVLFPILIIVSLGAVATVLLLGLADLARGKPDRARANRLMQWRIILQGVAIAVMLIAVLVARGH